MKRNILSLRLNRRAIGAAVLADESLTLVDGRHLTSERERATGTVVRLELRGPEADRSTLRAVLESDGLTVEERSRNLS